MGWEGQEGHNRLGEVPCFRRSRLPPPLGERGPYFSWVPSFSEGAQRMWEVASSEFLSRAGVKLTWIAAGKVRKLGMMIGRKQWLL